jgi:hypothetical protein
MRTLNRQRDIHIAMPSHPIRNALTVTADAPGWSPGVPAFIPKRLDIGPTDFRRTSIALCPKTRQPLWLTARDFQQHMRLVDLTRDRSQVEHNNLPGVNR